MATPRPESPNIFSLKISLSKKCVLSEYILLPELPSNTGHLATCHGSVSLAPWRKSTGLIYLLREMEGKRNLESTLKHKLLWRCELSKAAMYQDRGFTKGLIWSPARARHRGDASNVRFECRLKLQVNCWRSNKLEGK